MDADKHRSPPRDQPPQPPSATNPPSASASARANSDLNFPATPIHTPPLPLPSPADSLPTLHAKLRALSHLIPQNRSLAVETGYLFAARSIRDPVAAARAEMKPAEQEQWDEWREGTTTLPPMDWAENREAVAGKTPRSLAVARRRAEALGRLYGREGLVGVEHAVWFVANRGLWVPLLGAMARVVGVERDLRGGLEGVSPVQVAELQTLGRIEEVVAAVMVGRRARGDWRAEEVWRVREALGRRLKALRGLVKGGVKRKADEV